MLTKKFHNPLDDEDSKDFLGVRNLSLAQEIEEENRVGVVTGLAWDRSWWRNT